MGTAAHGDRGNIHCVNLTSGFAEDLTQQIERFWQTESFGVAVNLQASRSVEDVKALQVLQEGTYFDNGHYVVPMLWKDSVVQLPQNRHLAEKRFTALQKRLANDPVLRSRYIATMQGYIDKGYAKKMTPEEVNAHSSLTWFLPHHSVINPRKPEKIRVVFDAAAVYEDVSLNNSLITGPDLLNSLFGVLQRFRLRPVALVADIADMFYQVRVTDRDSDALRFLWKDDITSSASPDVYRMLVHIFGARDSPCCANYALQRVATDHEDMDALVKDVLLSNFYVDDMLLSVNNVETGKSLASSITDCLAAKGFKLHKWMSSSKEVLASIPEEDRAKPDINLALCDLPVEKTLGITWDVQLDCFVFTQPICEVAVPTKRKIVSVVSAIFDPCGFLTPFTFIAKCLIQDIWRENIGWDDVIKDHQDKEWKLWIDDLQYLPKLHIPRYHGLDVDSDVEMHVFCDASEMGFAAVSYLRIRGTTIRCSFLASKSHVAPVKSTLTIPKLELQGAVMAVRLAEVLLKEIDVKITRVLYWTDSITVLRYIQNESQRWKIFVANRVTEIREKSLPSQWRYVHTSLNPADIATRGASIRNMTIDTLWFRGPAYLLLQEQCWPEQPEVGPPLPSDDNLRKTVLFTTVDKPHWNDLPLKYNISQMLHPERFSSWYGLKRHAAWFLRAVRNFMAGCSHFKLSSIKSSRLTVTELREIEFCLIRLAQQECFRKDYSDLSNGVDLHERSHLRPLTPFFDHALGVIRVGGRLKHSDSTFEAKHQVLLPFDHHVTKLIIHEEHVRTSHAGPEHVMASLRKKYWPIKCRSLVKQCAHRCMDCRKRTAKATVPLMADLPIQRVKGYTRSFQFTGVDYFGPLLVKRARARLKKWVCLFTCLVTRAIHLELADSLEADDFIMALRSFIGRRGRPAEIFCDNGKNFVGASNELKGHLASLDHSDDLHSFMLKSSIEWHFIPPNAPHFGGAWERLVKSTKSALKSALKEQCVAETVLRTALIETEDVINSRPLTHNSTDPSDFTALTPNHFLRQDSNPHVPPGSFVTADRDSRKRWRQSQILADHLFRRWCSEYLPHLTLRRKWTLSERNLMVNDLVLLVEDKKPRGQWPLARIIEVAPSNDGVVRSLKVRTAQGATFLRPAAKVCVLEEALS